MREIEAKLKVDSHDAVRARLEEVGAERTGAVVEDNRIFDRPDGSLRRAGSGLRLRTDRPVDGGKRVTTLTFKGPVAPGPLKSRDELEVTVDDAVAAHGILSGLGFAIVLSYEKRRESWRFGGCRVELDEVPALGRFVEIEGPDEETIGRAQQVLNLGGCTHVRQSYVHLLTAYAQEHDLPAPVFSIENGDLPEPDQSGASSSPTDDFAR